MQTLSDYSNNKTLIIACGALARELKAIKQLNHWHAVDLYCLPAELHNYPEKIPAAVQAAITKKRDEYADILIAYADCGTGGQLDRVLAKEGIERLPGAHCYEFIAGSVRFHEMAEEEPGSFYLTDFLARHFKRLVIEAMQLDKHPQLKSMMFQHYRKLIYLAQTQDDTLLEMARHAADYLDLTFTVVECGYGNLQSVLQNKIQQNNQIKVVAHG